MPLRGPPRAERLLFALVPLGMLLLSDVSLTSHAAVLVIPYAALVAELLEGPERPACAAARRGIVASFMLGAMAAVPLLKQLSCLTAAVVCIFVVCCWLLFGLRRENRARRGMAT